MPSHATLLPQPAPEPQFLQKHNFQMPLPQELVSAVFPLSLAATASTRQPRHHAPPSRCPASATLRRRCVSPPARLCPPLAQAPPAPAGAAFRPTSATPEAINDSERCLHIRDRRQAPGQAGSGPPRRAAGVEVSKEKAEPIAHAGLGDPRSGDGTIMPPSPERSAGSPQTQPLPCPCRSASDLLWGLCLLLQTDPRTGTGPSGWRFATVQPGVSVTPFPEAPGQAGLGHASFGDAA